MELRKNNVWVLATVIGAALAGTAVVQGCGGDDAVATDDGTKDAGTTSTTVDSGTAASTCAAPATMCGESCVDTKNDPKNCGACGTVCAAGLTCSEGACGLACSGGATKCGDACVDTDLDVNNCGACGTKCAAGQVCSNGACGLTCASPLATCGANTDAGIGQSFCANVKKDVANCGACGTTCASNETCVDGACSAGCSTAAQCGSGAAKCVANKCVVPQDCSEIKSLNPTAPSGPYTIDLDGAGALAPFTAYCDMVTDGGGWTVIAGYAGNDGEEPLVSDTEKSGNPLLFQHAMLNRAKKIALSNLSSETIIVRSDARWLKADKPMFASTGGKDLTVADTDDAFAVKLNGMNGQILDGYMGWSNYKIDGGGDFGITVGADANGTVNGFDHHSTNYTPPYYQLNGGCSRQAFFSYSSQVADGDGSYKSSFTVGGWNAVTFCSNDERTGHAFYAAMRRHIGTLPASCVAIKTANPNAADGWYVVDPDGNGAVAPVGVYCDMTTDGGGYLMLPVTGGVSSSQYTQPNACKDLGMNLVAPRSLAHMKKLSSTFNYTYLSTVGVYRDVAPSGDGSANYTGCAMNSDSNSKCSADWKAAGGGAWFLNSANFGEPNGNYTLNCWLGNWGGLVGTTGATYFDDNNCGFSTGANYVCSDYLK